MALTSRQMAHVVLVTVIGGAALWFVFRDVELHGVGQALALVPAWAVGIHLLLGIAQVVLRTLRWMLQVEGLSGRRPSLREGLAVSVVSFAAVFLLPFRLGEFVRPQLAAQRGYSTRSAGLAHSALERVVDGLVTTALFGVVLLLLRDRGLPVELWLAGFVALAVFGGAIVSLLVAARYREASERFWFYVIGKAHGGLAIRCVGLLGAFLEGIRCFRSRTAWLTYLAYSVCFWLLNGLGMWVLLVCMAPEAGLLVAYFALCFVVLGVMLPAPPGNVGNYHAFMKLGLTTLGVTETTAAAYAVLNHGLSVASLVVLALGFLLSGDVSWRGVRDATLEAEAEPSSGGR
ncbi:MAG: lysylphosphatidylglycerol synthase transmembrane domain-containing protein [Myxococcota bacterium]